MTRGSSPGRHSTYAVVSPSASPRSEPLSALFPPHDHGVPMDTHFTTSDGARIAFADVGAGRPVVLLHGMLCHRGHWALQSAALRSAGYRVITVEHRFHGHSDSPEHGHSIARLGADLMELLTALELADVSLVGHSMGVSVALAAIGLGGTARLSALVAIDQSPRIVNDESWEWGVRHVTWPLLEDQIAGRAGWSEFEREPPAPAHVEELLGSCGRMGDFTTLPRALVFDHFASDWRDVLPLVDIPALLVTGRHSPSFPLGGFEWMAATMPDAHLSVYEASGHCPHWNEPEKFNDELIAFLDRTTRASARGTGTADPQ
ncbi:alpha/beta fold hydrolase [Microbacterium sp. NPDC055683]